MPEAEMLDAALREMTYYQEYLKKPGLTPEEVEKVRGLQRSASSEIQVRRRRKRQLESQNLEPL